MVNICCTSTAHQFEVFPALEALRGESLYTSSVSEGRAANHPRDHLSPPIGAFWSLCPGQLSRDRGGGFLDIFRRRAPEPGLVFPVWLGCRSALWLKGFRTKHTNPSLQPVG